VDSYFDHQFDCAALRLSPGDYAAVDDDTMLVTTLGSCVAACVWDESAGIGGMNHFMLPHSRNRDGSVGVPYLSYAGSYGVNAMEMMINAVLLRGGDRRRLQAKIFGGAAVLKLLNAYGIGQENAGFAKAYLQCERIPIASADLGGSFPRQIRFWPKNGEVLVRYLKQGLEDVDVVKSETAYAQRLRRPRYGTVELFDPGARTP